MNQPPQGESIWGTINTCTEIALNIYMIIARDADGIEHTGIMARKETAEKKNWQDRLHAVIDELNKEDNRRLILNAFYSVNPMQIDRFMQNYFRPAVEEILTEYIQDVDISEENREFMIRMYDLFWVDLLMRWIQTGMEISEMTGDIEKIMYVMTGSSQYIAQSLKAFENKDRKALRPAGEKNKKN